MKYLKYCLIILVFASGITIGLIINDLPYIELDTTVKVFEPLSFFLTATIGILIPFFIKRWIDDSRQIKNNLIDEIKDTLREIATIKDKIKFCYNNKSINASDKQEINVFFEQIDLKIKCLEQLFIESFDSETKSIRSEISNDYLEYWKLTTGAELMSSKFKAVNENFYKRHNDCFTKLETKMKQAINKIHRL